jgi:hypothetical protein
MIPHNNIFILPLAGWFIAGLICLPVWSTNVSFMPGDAFFHSRLTEQAVASMPRDGGSWTIIYSSNDESGNLSGFAGFRTLSVQSVSSQVVMRIHDVYSHLNPNNVKTLKVFIDAGGKRKEVETGGFHFFVYNRDVDWSFQRLALKYNEDWVDIPNNALQGSRKPANCIKGFPGVGPVRTYSPFIRSYEAVVSDWRDAKAFAPLKVSVPNNIAWGVIGPRITEPVEADMKDVQFVILERDNLRKYYHRKLLYEYFLITESGIQIAGWEKGKLNIANWRPVQKR